MSEVYVAGGYIEDGMYGIPFILGIFNDLQGAEREVLKIIHNNHYTILGIIM